MSSVRLRRAGWIIAIGAAGAALVVAFLARRNPVARAPEETLTFVEAVLPAPRERVLEAIGRSFQYMYEGARTHWIEGCYLSAYETREEPSLFSGPDPALSRFMALPAERKRDDSWLVCDGMWPSEYQSPRGEPLPFKTNFIIHVEPISADATRVEVVEYFPYVVAGKRLGFQREGPIPWIIPDVQTVAPTTRDRVHVLNVIRETLQQR